MLHKWNCSSAPRSICVGSTHQWEVEVQLQLHAVSLPFFCRHYHPSAHPQSAQAVSAVRQQEFSRSYKQQTVRMQLTGASPVSSLWMLAILSGFRTCRHWVIYKCGCTLKSRAHSVCVGLSAHTCYFGAVSGKHIQVGSDGVEYLLFFNPITVPLHTCILHEQHIIVLLF